MVGQSDRMLHCARCSYSWMPRKGGVPQRCPRCRSVKWNMPFLNLTCKRCGYEWSSHNGSPKRCPNCGTHQWNTAPKEYTCKRCGNTWQAKGSSVPKRCPACASREWARDYPRGEEPSVRRGIVVSDDLSNAILESYKGGKNCLGIAMDMNLPFSIVFDTVRNMTGDIQINT